ncbi:MAG: outer membrane beta-barrel protein [Helicobacter sp.]|uniref:outer membrane beta-barrel protein n=1 Tax=Helicobacter sp. TaxID=218 RepID=UPI002A91BD36|nr:outer membrane beta-barrel protein [Helicobacter sp.]MDY5949959.1 outer membrane beta-barrel protein [Helicobacter sp.]
MGFEKSIKASVLSLMLVSSMAYASEGVENENRAFVGLQVGTSMLKDKHKLIAKHDNITNKDSISDWNFSVASYGVLGGYEYWFSNNLGVRGYALVSMSSTYRLYAMHFGIGADVMYNFVEIAGGNIGVVGGLQLGGVYWGKGYYIVYEQETVKKPLAFDIALNIGLRYSQDKHVLELVGKIPFIESHIGTRDLKAASYASDETYAREVYSIIARYMYRF